MFVLDLIKLCISRRFSDYTLTEKACDLTSKKRTLLNEVFMYIKCCAWSILLYYLCHINNLLMLNLNQG